MIAFAIERWRQALQAYQQSPLFDYNGHDLHLAFDLQHAPPSAAEVAAIEPVLRELGDATRALADAAVQDLGVAELRVLKTLEQRLRTGLEMLERSPASAVVDWSEGEALADAIALKHGAPRTQSTGGAFVPASTVLTEFREHLKNLPGVRRFCEEHGIATRRPMGKNGAEIQNRLLVDRDALARAVRKVEAAARREVDGLSERFSIVQAAKDRAGQPRH